jgi:hypothetical protein
MPKESSKPMTSPVERISGPSTVSTSKRMKGNKYSKKVALAEAEKLYPGAPARQSAWDAAAATYGKATLLELTAARRLIAFDAAYESKKR